MAGGVKYHINLLKELEKAGYFNDGGSLMPEKALAPGTPECEEIKIIRKNEELVIQIAPNDLLVGISTTTSWIDNCLINYGKRRVENEPKYFEWQYMPLVRYGKHHVFNNDYYILKYNSFNYNKLNNIEKKELEFNVTNSKAKSIANGIVKSIKKYDLKYSIPTWMSTEKSSNNDDFSEDK
ncbi:hypothetical protein H8356DRAFT_1327305 [Neocallimastix lanati (nom. inval.)]|nr:hypothetical protein H8356DRAFT_1327305 [Neocallimastix sp. JGI-2020a]